MIQHLLKEMGGIGLYGVVSVCLFFLIFGLTLAWTLALKKPFLKSMESLPLQEENPCAKKGDTRDE